MNVFNDKFNDHFLDKEEEPKPQPVHEETPQEREEREIEESIIERRHDTAKWAILGTIAVLAILLVTFTWRHFYSPYAHGVAKGWIIDVKNEGRLFKTLECKMLTQDYVLDTVKVKWTRDTVLVDGCNFEATFVSDSLATLAVQWQSTGRRVQVSYDEYSGTLPWRGASSFIITAIDPDTLSPQALSPVTTPVK